MSNKILNFSKGKKRQTCGHTFVGIATLDQIKKAMELSPTQ